MTHLRRSSICLIAALTACGADQRPGTRGGLELTIAPLNLPGIGVACYDVAVTTPSDTVWSRGVPARTWLGHDQSLPGDPLGAVVGLPDTDSVCSDVYGNGPKGDIAYVGPCDASAAADTVPGGTVQNTVTVWVDGLYDAGKLAAIGEWQDPCPSGCELQIDCDENEDSLATFDLTIMRQANQGFFDIAVNFDDIFCSAKFDTCYPNATEDLADDEHIELLFGGDLVRDWTGVFGFACTAGPDSNTTLAYGDIAVSCAGGVGFDLDPTLSEGSNHIAVSGSSQLHYGIYRGNEQLACDDTATTTVVESCRKRYWNLAIDLADLASFTGCSLTLTATATDGNQGFANGLPTGVGVAYPYIEVDASLGSACQHNALGDGGAVGVIYRGNVDGMPAPEPVCDQYHGTVAANVCVVACDPADHVSATDCGCDHVVCGSGEVCMADGAALGCAPALTASLAMTGCERDEGSGPEELVAMGGAVYFAAFDRSSMTEPSHGYELWKSDGTAGGTVLVKDIHIGSGDSDPEELTVIGDLLYFVADDGVNGRELWQSDGTEAGTIMVADLEVGAGGSYPWSLTVVGTTLYFAAYDVNGDHQLWKKVGASGPELVRDFAAEGNDLEALTALGDTLAFTAGGGEALWTSDGTAGGTAPLLPGGMPLHAADLRAVMGTLYFRGTTASDWEPWVSDGTSAGTRELADLSTDSSSYPDGFTAMGGWVYFIADTSSAGQHGLWKTDGTPTNTSLVAQFDSIDDEVVAMGGAIYFSAWDPLYGHELWKSDGTAAGTLMVRDIAVGENGADPRSLLVAGSTLFFAAWDPASGGELWKSDGTEAGTVQIKEINATLAGDGSSPERLVLSGTTVFFAADDGLHGRELWRSDGTASGTVMVANLDRQRRGSVPRELTAVGQALFFTATDCGSGEELWRRDGSGSALVRDIWSGWAGSEPVDLFAVGTALYFTAYDGIHGRELWKSEGTDAGTVMVADISPGQESSSPRNFVVVGGSIYFQATDPDHGDELWKSDGTAAGTLLVKDILEGSGGSNPEQLTIVGTTLYFVANDGVHGHELWRSDGTASGTSLVKDNVVGPGDARIEELTAVGPTLYFRAWSADHGYELWKSDGTEAGTSLVRDIRPGTLGSWPESLAAFGSTLFFSAFDEDHGAELWMSDGTPSGTTVQNLAPDEDDSYPYWFTPSGPLLYFIASHDGGEELWRTDGTPGGAALVKDVVPGGGGSDPIDLVAGGFGTVYFVPNDQLHGYEIWRSNGTAWGTAMLIDLAPGADGSSPRELTILGDTLYFSANDGFNGDELYAIDLAP